MSKKLIGTLIALVAIFSLLILLIAINFGGVKERYKQIEPNLDNYSVAEILFWRLKGPKPRCCSVKTTTTTPSRSKRKSSTLRFRSWRAVRPSATLFITTTSSSRMLRC